MTDGYAAQGVRVEAVPDDREARQVGLMNDEPALGGERGAWNVKFRGAKCSIFLWQ